MGKRQRIVVTGDQALFEAGLRALLAADHDIEVQSESRAQRESARNRGMSSARVVLVDKSSRSETDPESIDTIKRRYPKARVLLITERMKDDGAHLAARDDIDACLRKDATQEEFRTAIHRLLHGMPPRAADFSADATVASPGGPRSAASNSRARLTPREAIVLKLVAEGRSSRAIAEMLNVSVKTVSKHRASLMAKLDLHNAASLTAYAIMRGLLP